MRRLLLSTVAAVLLLNSSAQAWTPAVWQASLDIARVSWPDSPCAGREQIAIRDDLPAGTSADSYLDGSCRVEIRRGLSDYGLCVVMVHEFGHLAGRSHADVDDHERVMAPMPTAYTPCNVVAPRIAAAALFKVTPLHCTLAAASPSRRVYRCGSVRAGVTLTAGVVVAVERLLEHRPHPKLAAMRGHAA